MKINKHLFTIVICWGLAICSYAQTITIMGAEKLPASSKAELDKKYRKYQVNSIVNISDSLRKTTYKVELQKKSKLITLLYDADGIRLSKEKNRIFTYDGTEKPKAHSPTGSGNRGRGGHVH